MVRGSAEAAQAMQHCLCGNPEERGRREDEEVARQQHGIALFLTSMTSSRDDDLPLCLTRLGMYTHDS
jgi:hypothetical protein